MQFQSNVFSDFDFAYFPVHIPPNVGIDDAIVINCAIFLAQINFLPTLDFSLVCECIFHTAKTKKTIFFQLNSIRTQIVIFSCVCVQRNHFPRQLIIWFFIWPASRCRCGIFLFARQPCEQIFVLYAQHTKRVRNMRIKFQYIAQWTEYGSQCFSHCDTQTQ